MHGDDQRYCDLLIAADGLLHQAEMCLDAHDLCSGCDLCRDAAGVEYCVSTLLDLALGSVPEAMHQNLLASYKSSKRQQPPADDPAIAGPAPET